MFSSIQVLKLCELTKRHFLERKKVWPEPNSPKHSVPKWLKCSGVEGTYEDEEQNVETYHNCKMMSDQQRWTLSMSKKQTNKRTVLHNILFFSTLAKLSHGSISLKFLAWSQQLATVFSCMSKFQLALDRSFNYILWMTIGSSPGPKAFLRVNQQVLHSQ